MLVYFAALLTAAVVLFWLHPQRQANRWAAFFLAFASVGGLSGYIREDLLPALAARPVALFGYDILRLVGDSLEAANHTLTPYGVLVFCAVYAERLPRFWPLRLRPKLLLLIPPIATAAAYYAVTDKRDFFLLLLLWALPYYAASCWLLLSAFFRERNRWKRRERLAVVVLVVPTLVAIALFINVASVWEPGYRFFDYVAIFIAYSLLAGVAFAFGSGVLGVKVRIERDVLESTVSAVGSGTAMLNHTIKNEIAKISMCAENVKSSLDPHNGEASEQLDIIVKSAEYMKLMVARIHGQTQHIALAPVPCRLTELVRECLRLRASELARNRIQVQTVFECDPVLECDPVHIREVINNLISNALEAMPDDGRLLIRISATKRNVVLSFEDDGAGMSKEQRVRALEPFYTTKAKTGNNFGLGLTYCYQVMKQSGGAIEVDSEAGAGTTVKLLFPLNKKLERNVVEGR